MAPPSLEDLPAETFATIVEHLGLADLRRLRSTSSILCHLTTQAKFKGFCSAKQVLLTKQAVQKFLHIARTSPSLAATLRSLTLVHPLDEDARLLVPPDSPPTSVDLLSDESKRLESMRALRMVLLYKQAPEPFSTITKTLDDAFRHLMLSKSGFLLGCLRLVIAEPTETDENEMGFGAPNWFYGPAPAIEKTFKIVFGALQTSRLPAAKLDLFCQRDHALGWDVLENLGSNNGRCVDADNSNDPQHPLHAVLASLQYLAIQVCEPVSHGPLAKAPLEPDVIGSRNEAYGASLQRLLHLPQNLLSLDLTFYQHCASLEENPPTDRLFRQLGSHHRLDSLQQLSLVHLSMTISDLCELLQGCHTTLARLVLRYVRLDTTRSIKQLFHLCTNPSTSPALKYFEFRTFTEQSRARRIIFTDQLWTEREWSYEENRRAACYTLIRKGVDIRNPIGFIWWDCQRQVPMNRWEE